MKLFPKSAFPLCLALTIVMAFASEEAVAKPKGKMVATASVIYALDKEGNRKTGILIADDDQG